MTARRIVLIALLAVAALAAATVGTFLLADADPDRPPHAAPVAARALDSSGGERTAFAAAYDQAAQRAIDEQVAAYLAAVHEEHERERLAAPVPRASPTTAAVAQGSCSGDVACFLACTIGHESASSGTYSAVSPSGTYRGAYQFDAATWAAAVSGAGYAEYASTPADQAPAHVQDAAAAHLYSVSGNRPWGGRC